MRNVPPSPRPPRTPARLAGLLALLAFAAMVVDPAGASSARRVVAVGDIHGAWNGVRTILREVELIDDKDRWAGGDAVLVQTGDVLDRGPGAIAVAELLMSLQEQAPGAGGEVIVLLGNHEVLNLIGDLRDVTEHILRTLVDNHSDKRLTVSCNEYAGYHRRWAQAQGQKPAKRRQLLDECFATQQPGLAEYLEAIGPEGKIGRWIRGLPTAVQIGDVVFVHGGLSPEMAGRSLQEINRDVRREIESFDAARRYLLGQGLILPTSGLRDILTMARWLHRNATEVANGLAPVPAAPLPAAIEELVRIDEWLLIREDGPLWFRGYAQWDEGQEAESKLRAVLEPLGAKRVVVAHTPQRTMSITARFASEQVGPRVFLIDTGMLTSVYKGRPSALLIADGSFTAVYAGHRKVLYGAGATALADAD